MERQSFKITFYLRRNRVTKAGLAPILSRVTVNGIAAEIPVKLSNGTSVRKNEPKKNRKNL
ncbi:Uncharacterised protein [Rikenella microfusus]|uniref:Arm DNA-binding domain-containing protein n=1 Tax=Rikenella microfusus TaxID=28139 RepID=A0A379MRG8_9BACT|nr:Uncharacterised protein [Rikenella microfusus]